jgi:hypothetical protein
MIFVLCKISQRIMARSFIGNIAYGIIETCRVRRKISMINPELKKYPTGTM